MRWNFAPRVRIPVLMLNGRSDFMVPFEPNQRLLFEALGTKDKVFKRYDGGHANLVTRPDLIGEILTWLDKYPRPCRHPAVTRAAETRPEVEICHEATKTRSQAVLPFGKSIAGHAER